MCICPRGGRGVTRRDLSFTKTPSGPCPDCVICPQTPRTSRIKCSLLTVALRPALSGPEACTVWPCPLCSPPAPAPPACALLQPYWPPFCSSNLPQPSLLREPLHKLSPLPGMLFSSQLLSQLGTHHSGRSPSPLLGLGPVFRHCHTSGPFGECIVTYDCALM